MDYKLVSWFMGSFLLNYIIPLPCFNRLSDKKGKGTWTGVQGRRDTRKNIKRRLNCSSVNKKLLGLLTSPSTRAYSSEKDYHKCHQPK